jgi:hypothetical protein
MPLMAVTAKTLVRRFNESAQHASEGVCAGVAKDYSKMMFLYGRLDGKESISPGDKIAIDAARRKAESGIRKCFREAQNAVSW